MTQVGYSFGATVKYQIIDVKKAVEHNIPGNINCKIRHAMREHLSMTSNTQIQRDERMAGYIKYFFTERGVHVVYAEIRTEW